MEQNKWDELLNRMIEDLVPLMETRATDYPHGQLNDQMASRILRRAAARIAAAEDDGSAAAYAGGRRSPHQAQDDQEPVSAGSSRPARRTVRLGFEEWEPRNPLSTFHSLGAVAVHDSWAGAEPIATVPVFACSQVVCADRGEALAVVW